MHEFVGKWITDSEFYDLEGRNVFHRQLDRVVIDCSEHRNRHILYRKKFTVHKVSDAKMYITADDYYKLYINGKFVCQGPAPCYHFHYNYNTVDVSEYLHEGENTIAVHTLYQGLINRVWQSGDRRHGMICDLVADGVTVVSSDERFKCSPHDGFHEIGTVGYATQFMEECDCNAKCVGFEAPDFDDSTWDNARVSLHTDYTLVEQESHMLEFERIEPVSVSNFGKVINVDFGSIYVGYLGLTLKGKKGDRVGIRCAQELNPDGSVRWVLRCNCKYVEDMILADGISKLCQFDYKSFRYVELDLPRGCEIVDVYFMARHYPFKLTADIKPEYRDDEKIKAVWDLCINTQKWGVQEVIQDCMEREKGFYLGDGCYTALCNMILTGDDSMVRKLIDDALRSSFITDGLVTCMDCSFMQEIAEYPLILVYLVLWHYRLTGDREYLSVNYAGIIPILEAFRRDYERDGLLSHLDKWCVVDWPENFRDGYDVDIREGKVCEEAHISINAYYIEAVKTANIIAGILGQPAYRDTSPLVEAFNKAFYDADRHIFTDGEHTDHVSYIGNVFPYGYGLCPDDECKRNIEDMIRRRKVHDVSFFGTFVLMQGLIRNGEWELVREMLTDDGAWLRIIREGGTVTFEGWGRDTKWNTSLFHLTMSMAAIFIADIDVFAILK